LAKGHQKVKADHRGGQQQGQQQQSLDHRPPGPGGHGQPAGQAKPTGSKAKVVKTAKVSDT
jgi:hypothetical protein